MKTFKTLRIYDLVLLIFYLKKKSEFIRIQLHSLVNIFVSYFFYTQYTVRTNVSTVVNVYRAIKHRLYCKTFGFYRQK